MASRPPAPPAHQPPPGVSGARRPVKGRAVAEPTSPLSPQRCPHHPWRGCRRAEVSAAAVVHPAISADARRTGLLADRRRSALAVNRAALALAGRSPRGLASSVMHAERRSLMTASWVPCSASGKHNEANRLHPKERKKL